jgi:hypothetical protein
MKPRPGDLIAGISGVLLFVSLFFDWYGTNGATATAWQAFDVLDLLVALAGLAGLAVLLTQATVRRPAIPVAVSVVATAIAALAFLGILYRLVNQPGPNDAIDVEPGLYMALLLTALMFYGCGKAMRDESPRASPQSVAVEDLPAPLAVAEPREPT